MISQITHWFCGILSVSAEGRNLSRFFNLCARHDFAFRNVTYHSPTTVSFWMDLQDFYELKPYLKKTKTRLRIQQKRGLPFLLKKYQARKLYALVLLLAVIGVWFLSTRIWRIEITGNASLGEDTVLEYLQKHDITYGMPASAIDNDALELALRQDFDPVIWASVYEQGTKLVVCLQEKIAVKETSVESDVCMDLVATKDATISSVITRSGLSEVKKGDKVKKGDLLVCGRQEILDDNGEVREYYYKSADADIYGYTTYPYEDTIPGKMTVSSPTGNETRQFFIQILQKRFTTPALHAPYPEKEAVAQTRQFVVADSFYLPVYWGTITSKEIEKTTVSVTKEAAKTIALSHFLQFLSDLEENGVRIVDKNVMIEQIDENYHIYGKVKACEKITCTAPTEIKRKEPVNESE